MSADADAAGDDTPKAEETHEPNMTLAQQVFRQGREPTPELEKEIRATIEKGEMGPYYEHVCAKFGWPVDAALLEGMKAKNAAELAALVAKKEDAEKNQGDMEVLDALFDAVKFHARVGAKAEAYAACDAIRDRPKISTGKRIDALMMKIRVSLFFVDVAACKEQLAEAQQDLAHKTQLLERTRNELEDVTNRLGTCVTWQDLDDVKTMESRLKSQFSKQLDRVSSEAAGAVEKLREQKADKEVVDRGVEDLVVEA